MRPAEKHHTAKDLIRLAESPKRILSGDTMGRSLASMDAEVSEIKSTGREKIASTVHSNIAQVPAATEEAGDYKEVTVPRALPPG